MLIALALAVAVPSAEAEALGAQLARMGAAAGLLPMLAHQQIEALVAEHPELNDADKMTLRGAGETSARTLMDKLFATTGRGYAAALSVEDLRAVVKFEQSPPAIHYRGAMPQVVVDGMKTLGATDLKADTLAAFCAKTGKLCAAK